jgi:hypothetical protein
MEKNVVAIAFLLVLIALPLLQSSIPQAHADINCSSVCDHLGGLSEPFLGSPFDVWTGSGVRGYSSSPYSTWDGFWQGGVGAYNYTPYAHPYSEVGPLAQHRWLSSAGSGTYYNYTLAAVYRNIHLLEPRDVWCPGWYNDASWLGNNAFSSSSISVAADDTFDFNNGSSCYTIYGRQATVPDYERSQSDTSTVQGTRSNQPIELTPLFDVQVTYAYVGPRTNDFACPNPFQSKTSTAALNAASLYPSLIRFNARYVANVTSEACDAAIEVYQAIVTTDTGVTESYIFTVGTNINPTFSNVTALSHLRADIVKLAGNFTNAAYGFFDLNLAVGNSISLVTAGSVGSFQSDPSGLGFWSAGQPNSATISMYRLGCILLNEKSISTYHSDVHAATTQVQLEKYSNGLLYNTALSETQMQQIDPFKPPM